MGLSTAPQRWYPWMYRLSRAPRPLQWRHNGRDRVSNHQPHDCLLHRLFRGPVNYPHKWPVTRKMFPFDDVIMPRDIPERRHESSSTPHHCLHLIRRSGCIRSLLHPPMIFYWLSLKVFTIHNPNGSPIFIQSHLHLGVVAREMTSHVINVPSWFYGNFSLLKIRGPSLLHLLMYFKQSFTFWSHHTITQTPPTIRTCFCSAVPFRHQHDESMFIQGTIHWQSRMMSTCICTIPAGGANMLKQYWLANDWPQWLSCSHIILLITTINHPVFVPSTTLCPTSWLIALVDFPLPFLFCQWEGLQHLLLQATVIIFPPCCTFFNLRQHSGLKLKQGRPLIMGQAIDNGQSKKTPPPPPPPQQSQPGYSVLCRSPVFRARFSPRSPIVTIFWVNIYGLDALDLTWGVFQLCSLFMLFQSNPELCCHSPPFGACNTLPTGTPCVQHPTSP